MSRKPDTKTAMYQLLEVIREHIPVGLKEAAMCKGICRGWSK